MMLLQLDGGEHRATRKPISRCSSAVAMDTACTFSDTDIVTYGWTNELLDGSSTGLDLLFEALFVLLLRKMLKISEYLRMFPTTKIWLCAWSLCKQINVILWLYCVKWRCTLESKKCYKMLIFYLKKQTLLKVTFGHMFWWFTVSCTDNLFHWLTLCKHLLLFPCFSLVNQYRRSLESRTDYWNRQSFLKHVPFYSSRTMI